MVRLRLVAPLLSLVLAAPLSEASDTDDRVLYEVDLERAAEQVIEITLTLPDTDAGPVNVHLPVWRPGLYRFLDPAGTVRTFEPRRADGATLPWAKTRRSSWRVESEGGPVSITYELVADSLGNRTRHADSTHAFMSGSSVFMYADELRGQPLAVAITPPSWAEGAWRVATGLESAADEPFRLLAPDYDRLVDSPIEVGEHELVTFEAAGATHELATWGMPAGGTAADRDRVVADIAAIVRAQAEIFGGLPYERFVFITHIGEGLGGGTEHWNSTVLSARPNTFSDPDRYESFLGLVAHEVFHVWNVKRLRPAALSPYEYQRESLTDLLWVAEGVTSYYDELTLPRAGLVDAEEFLEFIGRVSGNMIDRGGWGVQSLADSSRDAWIKQFVSHPDARNSRVSIYDDGALAAMAIDLMLRSRSDSSLDAVMRAMYEKYPLGSGGYTTADLLGTIKETSGVDMRGFFADHIEGRSRIDLPPLLEYVGLKMRRREPPGGVDLRFAERGGEVSWVRAGSPAAQAGLNPGDRLVAINGMRYQPGGLGTVARQLPVGRPVTVSFFRFGRLRTVAFQPQLAIGAWEIVPVEDASNRQKAEFNRWTGVELPEN